MVDGLDGAGYRQRPNQGIPGIRDEADGDQPPGFVRPLPEYLPAAVDGSRLYQSTTGNLRETRLHPHPVGVCRPAAGRGHHVDGRHRRQLADLPKSDLSGIEPQHVRRPLLDLRHRGLRSGQLRRRFLRWRQGPGLPGTLHAHVPARDLQSDLPLPRIGDAARGLGVRSVHRRPREVRPAAVSADALHLFPGLEGHQRGIHDHEGPADGFSLRSQDVLHRRPIHVWSGAHGVTCHRIHAASPARTEHPGVGSSFQNQGRQTRPGGHLFQR